MNRLSIFPHADVRIPPMDAKEAAIFCPNSSASLGTCEGRTTTTTKMGSEPLSLSLSLSVSVSLCLSVCLSVSFSRCMMQKQDKWRLSKMITHSPLLSFFPFLPSFLSLRNFHFSSPPLSAFYCIWVVEGGRRTIAHHRRRRRHGRGRATGRRARGARPLLPICKRSKEVGSIAAVTNFGHDNYLLTYSRGKQSLRRRRRFMETAKRQKAR